jgi:hypothetical protein
MKISEMKCYFIFIIFVVKRRIIIISQAVYLCEKSRSINRQNNHELTTWEKI